MNFDISVLVADDMEGMRRILTNSLQQIGVKHVMTANNGADAWRMVQSHRFDVVISDWNMPQMTGLELLQAIRKSPDRNATAVLMMTAESEKHRVQMAIDAGVSGYMVKPFTVGALEAKLRKILAHESPSPEQRAAMAQVPAIARPRTTPSATLVPPDTADGAKAIVLAVDDVPDNLDILVATLGDQYSIKVASSGERALKILAAGKLPDLILLDVMMPEMDGFEVCRRIKADPTTRDIPVIFLTAMNEAVDVTTGFSVGAVDYVNKPAESAILHARIATHLRMRRYVAELQRNRIALIEQNAVLEENARLRDEFERIAQHDLKNPIAGIVSFASSLLNEATLQDQHKDIVRYIEQSGYRILDMVNLSLDLYKMEQGTYVLEPSTFNMVQLLRRMARELESELGSRHMRVQFSAHGNGVDSPPPAQVSGDETLCYSMFGNLLRNSLEAAQDGTTISIDIASLDKGVNVRITNDGVVPESIRDHFFDKFSTAGKPDGTGLGTFSARLIARTQGGDIEMDTSDTTRTTTVLVKLPSAELPDNTTPMP